MKTIKFNEKEYNIPEQWSEVTIGMLIKSDEYLEFLPDVEFICIISAYSGIDIELVRRAKSGDLDEVISCLGFISDPYESKSTNRFTFSGVEYSCADDLVNQSFEDWVSVQTILYRFKDNPVKGLARMIAVLCKRSEETLSDFNVNDRELLFMGLPMTIAKDVEGFFLHNLRAYKSITLLYSVNAEQEELIRYKLAELRDIMKKREGQVGIFSFTRFRIMYYRMYLWFFARELEKYFSFTHTDFSKKNSKGIVKK